eukprot:GHUV01041396.1.p1 GENE.GHUV01041396.1~~GHUV01041396.1.p1  ORF type:complete len:319 (+),score=66.40 GHUV01041396.1:337-1293(+)
MPGELNSVDSLIRKRCGICAVVTGNCCSSSLQLYTQDTHSSVWPHSAAAGNCSRTQQSWQSSLNSLHVLKLSALPVVLPVPACADACLFPRSHASSRALMARWLVAFCRASKWYIREEEPLEEELTAWLEPHELKQLVKSPHPPNFCILVLSHAVANSGLQEHTVVRLEENLSSLSQSLSSCDRILNTPIPLSYTRHTARFLILWLMLLPLALWGLCGWLMVPIVATISFVLLGIEEIGVQIEEPFSILALENLCRKAERHISGMMLMDQTTYDLVKQTTETAQHHFPAWQTAMYRSVIGKPVVTAAKTNGKSDGMVD